MLSVYSMSQLFSSQASDEDKVLVCCLESSLAAIRKSNHVVQTCFDELCQSAIKAICQVHIYIHTSCDVLSTIIPAYSGKNMSVNEIVHPDVHKQGLKLTFFCHSHWQAEFKITHMPHRLFTRLFFCLIKVKCRKCTSIVVELVMNTQYDVQYTEYFELNVQYCLFT